MKNIGLLISSLNSGGAERVVSHLSKILSKDFNVFVILFEDTYQEYECGGTVISLDVPSKSGSVFTKMSLLMGRVDRLKKLIRKENLDCVISFLDSPCIVNLLARTKGCKHIVSIRNYTSREIGRSAMGKITHSLIKWLYRKADHVVTVSKLIENDYIKNYGISPDKITTIYNPYDFETISRLSGEPVTEAEEEFLSSGFVFANVGRIMYQKGVWHLVKAFGEVHKSNPDTKLLLVGEDFTGGKLERLINELGLGDCILRTGRVRNPYKYMKRASCYVLSSLFEGFPNAMVEAMACGLPIIAADCKSGPREILYENPDLDEKIADVREADYGILVPALSGIENWEADNVSDTVLPLINSMKKMVNSTELCDRYSEKAYERSLEFSFTLCREKFNTVINN